MSTPTKLPRDTKLDKSPVAKEIEHLDGLDKKFELMSARVSRLDSIIDPLVPSSLIVASQELVRIIEDLELMQNQMVNYNYPSRWVFDGNYSILSLKPGLTS